MSLKNPFNEKIEGKNDSIWNEPAPLGLNPQAPRGLERFRGLLSSIHDLNLSK